MLYSEVRNTLKSGDLIAWKRKGVSSIKDFIFWLHQKITGSNYTHVGMVLVIGGRIFCLDAKIPVVRLIPLSLLSDFYLIKANAGWSSEKDSLALSYIGKKYSLVNFIRDYLGLSLKDDKVYCSNLISKIYKHIGFSMTDLDGTTPDELVNRVCNLNNTEPIFVSLDKGNFNDV